MPPKGRGSELLKRRYTEEDLMALLAATALDGVTLVDFFPKGIPAPDGGWGVWRVGQDQLLDLLRSILKQVQIPHLRVFPKAFRSSMVSRLSSSLGLPRGDWCCPRARTRSCSSIPLTPREDRRYVRLTTPG